MAVSVERPRRLFTIEEYEREDFLLVIEVADTSLEYDSTVKLAHARAGIADYWVVDASTQRIHVYDSPSGDRYREHRVFA